MSRVYKIGTAQSQQITTLAKLLTYSELETYMPQFPLCLSHIHDTNHLFNCSQVPIQQNTISLWKKLLEAADVNPRVGI